MSGGGAWVNRRHYVPGGVSNLSWAPWWVVRLSLEAASEVAASCRGGGPDVTSVMTCWAFWVGAALS